jgi:predicted kinase
MPEILVVTGTCGVGKTTVSRAWATARGGAAIHGDQIRNWIRPHALRIRHGFQAQLVADTSIAAAHGLLSQGLDVALDNVWFPESMELLRKALMTTGSMRFIWLKCCSQENHRRDQLRGADGAMGDRVDELQCELQAVTWPDYVHVLDTSVLSVSDTVAAIELLPPVSCKH